MAMPTFREKLADPSARMTAHLCTIPSPLVPQAIAAAGADAVIVDMEHGAVDHASAQAMIAATAGTDCAPLVRVAEIRASDVKRVLDLGAEGIVFPLIRTAEDAELAVSTLHYPPRGQRGFGPFIAHSRYGLDMMSYAASFSDRVVCCLLAETVEAVENIEAICEVPGIDLVIPAQFDLSVALGRHGQFDHAEFVAAVQRIETACNAAGIPLGGVGLSAEQAQAQFSRGYKVIAGFDILWLKAKVAEAQGWCN
jgi:4-hydroxy-2-oxoheptanedioate aldolase